MTNYLAELYTPKPAWLSLDQAERARFFEAIGNGMAALSSLGIEALAFGETESGGPHASPHQFFALWRLPGSEALAALLEGIEASGWHDYFDTSNAAGAGTDITGHLRQLADVKRV